MHDRKVALTTVTTGCNGIRLKILDQQTAYLKTMFSPPEAKMIQQTTSVGRSIFNE